MNESNYSREDGDLDEIEYRPLNTLAVVAFVLSLLSLAAWLNWFLVIIPVTSICLAVLARYIGRGKMAGQGLASAAIFVALMLGSFSIGYHQFRAFYLGRVASTHAQTMLTEVIRENYGSVVDYMKPPRSRRPEGTEAAEYYTRKTVQPGGQAPPNVEIQVVMSQEPIPTMVKDDFKGKLKYLGVGSIKQDLYSDIIGVDYRYTPASADLQEIEYRVIMLRRSYEPPLWVQWQVGEFEILKGPEQVRELVTYGNPPPSGPVAEPPKQSPE